MKKYLIFFTLTAMLVLASCTPLTDNSAKTADNQNSTVENNNDTFIPQQNGTLDTQAGNTQVQPYISSDASVEVLTQITKDFMYSAFSDDTDSMTNLCDEGLAQKIKNNPKLYIGTKPDYEINDMDMAIKPLDDPGKYTLQSDVTATKRSDKKKYLLKYTVDITKVNGDYYITDFKRVY